MAARGETNRDPGKDLIAIVGIKRQSQPDDDLVRIYLTDIGRHGLLTKPDEARRAQAIEAGRAAGSELVSNEALPSARKRELRGEPRSLDDIGAVFHLTRERTRQIEAKAMSKLRHPCTAHDGRELLNG